MAHCLHLPRSEMILRALIDGAAAPDRFFDLVERRAAHEPIAYIVGRQEFYGRNFRVTPDVLIPRADSETVVDAALAAMPSARRVLDCGVGSGALLVTYLLEVAGAKGVGVDCSKAALFVAENNAQRLGVGRARGRFLLRNWREPGWTDKLGNFDLIIANPPYVEEDAPIAPDVRHWEPAQALFSGPDGLDDYRVLIPQFHALLSDGGIAVLEIGATQAEAVADIAAQSCLTSDLRRDLAGRPRALVLRRACD